MIAIIDYGVGNLFSLSSSLAYLGVENTVTNKPEELIKADKIILPGVGAFGDAMEKLEATGLIPVLNSEVTGGKPLLGICLGMQLLFNKSHEYGEHKGLGYIQGKVVSLKQSLKDISAALKVPHMGWNSLRITDMTNPIISGVSQGDYVYFVHSFHACECENSLVAVSDYSLPITAIVNENNVYGTQFHPEKSGGVGLKILENFCFI